MRTIHRNDVHASEHLVKRCPVGRFERFLDRDGDGPPVMIVNLQAESLGPIRESLADAAHAHDLPSCLPPIRRPVFQVGAQPAHSPAGMTFAPSTSRRATARISAMVMSAVSRVRRLAYW